MSNVSTECKSKGMVGSRLKHLAFLGVAFGGGLTVGGVVSDGQCMHGHSHAAPSPMSTLLSRRRASASSDTEGFALLKGLALSGAAFAVYHIIVHDVGIPALAALAAYRRGKTKGFQDSVVAINERLNRFGFELAPFDKHSILGAAHCAETTKGSQSRELKDSFSPGNPIGELNKSLEVHGLYLREKPIVAVIDNQSPR